MIGKWDEYLKYLENEIKGDITMGEVRRIKSE